MLTQFGIYRDIASKDVQLRPITWLSRDLRAPKDAQRMARKRRLAYPNWLKPQRG